MNERIKKIKRFAQEQLDKDSCSGHRISHAMRVFNLAMKLAEGEKADKEVIQAAVLLHDIGGAKERRDSSGKVDHAEESARIAEPFLESLGYKEDRIKHIKDCILSHRYRNKYKPKSLEAKIIFDADKLEAVGAIGVARWFVWVGKNNAHIYKTAKINEYIKDNLGGNINGRIIDKTKHSPQLNWETKDKYIIKYLHTAKAKKIAKKRMEFSRQFLKELENEIKGRE